MELSTGAPIRAEKGQPSKFGRPGAALVVITQLSNEQGSVGDLVHDSVLIVDASGPVSGKAVLKGFGPTNPIEGVTPSLFDQLVDPFQDFLIGSLPVQIVFPSVLGKD
jgi:hypothetical protein